MSLNIARQTLSGSGKFMYQVWLTLGVIVDSVSGHSWAVKRLLDVDVYRKD